MSDGRPGRRPKISLVLDEDMVRWLRERARAAETTESVIVRQIIRAAMSAEREAGR